MELNTSIIKRHPVAAGGGIIVCGVLVYFLFLRGSSGAAVASDGTTVQERLAAMSYAAHAGDQQTQLAIAALQVNGQQGLATIQGTFSLKALEDQIAASIHQSDASNAAALQALSLQTAAALQQSQLAAATYQLQITEQSHVQQAQINASLQQTQAVTQAAVATAHENAVLQQTLAGYNAAIAINQANIWGAVQINQADQWAAVQINQSNNQRKASNHSSNNSLFGSIVGGLLGAFF